MKSGDCTFKVIDATGVRAIEGAKVVLTSSRDAEKTISAVAGKKGECKVDVASGAYVLTVNDQKIGVVEASVSAKIHECKIMLPSKPLQVGAQGETAGFTFLGLGGGAGIAAAVGVAGGVTYGIIELSDDSSSGTK